MEHKNYYLTPSAYPINMPPPYDAMLARDQRYMPMQNSLPSQCDGQESYADDSIDSTDIAILDQTLGSIPAPLSSLSSYPRLDRPVIIPQIGFGSVMSTPMPYTRAHAPVFETYGLSNSDVLKIIDTINICISASPPFQILQLASMGVGFVPSALASGISAGLGLVAGAGTATTCYYRTKRFLEKMNRDIMAPRGLKIGIMKDIEVLQLLGLSERSVWAKTRNSQQYPRVPGQPPLSLPNRRFHALEPHVAPLDFDVPPPESPDTILDKMSARQQARKASKEEHKQIKIDREKSKVEAQYGMQPGNGRKQNTHQQRRYDLEDSSFFSNETEISGSTSRQESVARMKLKLDRLNQKYNDKLVGASRNDIAKIEEKREKDIHKLEKELRKSEKYSADKRKDRKRTDKYAKEMKKASEKEEKVEEKEETKVQSLKWIVVSNL